MEGTHAWWETVPGERFWLGITGRDDTGEVLAAPRGDGRGAPAWRHPLITHVKDGDAVFHFDEARQAIVAWSTSRGRVRTRRLAWRGDTLRPVSPNGATRTLLSWTVALERPTMLDNPVRLDEIARIQWNLFPALRSLEDAVGEPLYYPFAMGSPTETRLMPGRVFKLPALLVEAIPALARVTADLRWSDIGRWREPERPARATEPLAESPDAKRVPAARRADGLGAR